VDEPKLYALLAAIYDQLRVQADSVYHLQCDVDATVQALKEEHSWFADSYNRHYRAYVEESADRQKEAQTSLDEIIQRLKAGRL
jgi:hypothetical protein